MMEEAKEQTPYDQMCEGMKNDPEWAWSWHCNIAMPIQDTLRVSPKEANHMAAVLMKHLFNVDMGQSPIYQQWLEDLECPPSPDGKHAPAFLLGRQCVYCGCKP